MKNIADIYRLSHTQQGILFHSALDEGMDVYHNQLSFVIDGGLDSVIFKQAWDKVVERHDILRTSFHWENLENPLQVVHHEAELEWHCEDWGTQPATTQQELLAQYLKEDKHNKFSLNKPCLMRVAVIKTGAGSNRVVWSFHHLILDGWCLPLVLAEVLEHYNALCEHKMPNPPAPPQYKQYISWLEELADDTGPIDYWRRELEGVYAPSVIKQYGKPVKDNVQAFDEIVLTIDQAESETLRSFVQEQGITLNTLFQGTWALLMSRYTGEQDVIFGTTTSGRSADVNGIDKTLGLFINTIPACFRLGDMSVIDWLKQNQLKHFEKEKHAFCALVEIHEVSDIAKDQPLFESLFVFENYPINELAFSTNSKLSLRDFQSLEQTNYPLTLVVIPGKQTRIQLTYNTGRYTKEWIGQLLRHYRGLLERITVSPDRNINHISIILPEEKQLLDSWNDTGYTLPEDKTFVQLWEENAVIYCNNIALADDNGIITYEELNERSNQLAHHLLSVGNVGKEDGVIILLSRSIEMAASILAVWKCGGYYIPVAEDYPDARISSIIEDAKPKAIITTESLLSDALREQYKNRLHVIRLDADVASISDQPAHNPGIIVAPGNLSYIIYTSGSTGKPKGAMVEHLGMLNHLLAKKNALNVNEHTKLVQNASQCFDISVWQFFTALLAGGKTYVYSDELVTSPEKFIQLVNTDGITILEVVPSYLAVLLSCIEQENSAGVFGDMKYLLVTGEAVPHALVKHWVDTFPAIPMVNAYGPTEASDDITHHFITTAPELPDIPIGKAIQNITIYIVDDHMNLCPPGIKGEICVSGISVGRGYMNNPTQTSAAFMNDPFAAAGDVRMYKTGDLGTYLPDGTILFFGRKDNQVKVRGYRIETGEIEARLSAMHGVMETVVKDFKNEQQETFLCAFVKTGDGISDDDLKAFLLKELPEYMVPACFVRVEQFPLTANGKTDRKKLEIPEDLIKAGTLSRHAPVSNSPVNAIVQTIWQAVLQKDSIQPGDHFFELGGHSLKAMQVMYKVKEAFSIDLPVRALFDHPTLSGFADCIIAQRSGKPAERITPVASSENIFSLSPSQERLWFIQQTQPASTVYNMSGCLAMKGALQVSLLERSIQMLLQKHKGLNMVFKAVNGVPMQQVKHLVFELPVIHVVDGRQLEEQIGEQSDLPFDLENGPVFRSHLYSLAAEEHVLLLSMHHIVADGWSVGILLEEITSVYNKLVQNRPVEIAQLPLQFYDYAAWHSNNIASGVYNKQLDYWKAQLNGHEGYLELPLDKARPEVQNFKGAVLPFHIDSVLSNKVYDYSRGNNVSAYMTLLSCFAVLLNKYSGQNDILIGSPVTNRPVKELEDVIGFFVNTVALRVRIGDEDTFEELSKQVRNICLDAFTNQDMPFEKVVECLDVKRQINVNPLFQVMFVMQHVRETVHFERLEVTGFETEVNTSKFDLTLIVEETPEGFRAQIEYDTALFLYDKIAAMAGHFTNLLNVLVADPEKQVAECSMLSAVEKDTILNVWSGKAKTYAPGILITDLLKERVAAHPVQVAVCDNSCEITYRDLDEMTSRLANLLLEHGVQAGDHVGLAIERSIASVAGMIAILKLGAVYVPLDPSYPEQRLQYMINDAATKLIITNKLHRTDIAKMCSKVVTIEDSEDVALLSDSYRPAITVADAAYINYTSGSTGFPKGVVVPHQAVIRLVMDTNYISIEPGQRVSHNSNISFDATTLEVWLPLLNGGTMVIPDKHDLLDIEHFDALLEHNRIDVMFLTTALFNQIANSFPASFGRLQYLVVGGDKALISTFDKVMTSASPPANLVNGYGPTENTTFSACYNYRSVQQAGQRIPIGKPITASTVYILDKYKKPVPAGVNGELYLGGTGLAICYLNNPQLTSEKFIEVELDEFRRELLYKTGDIGRFRNDGNIDFFGRNDKQVKLRGFRIELSEIESAILKAGNVKDCYVLADNNNERLVAFYVPEHGDDTILDNVKAHLKEVLPAYMLPSVYVKAYTIPLTSNGKTDVDKLKATMLPVVTGDDNAHTAIEEKLAGIWKEILQTGDIRINDNFFEIGGHSLLMVRMLAEVNKCFNLNISIQEGFENATVQKLAAVIEAGKPGNGYVSLPSVKKYNRANTIFPLSFAQERLWFLNEFNAGQSAYNIYAALELLGVLNIDALEYALQTIMQRHEILRTVFAEQNFKSYQKIKEAAPVKITPISIGDQSTLNTLLQEEASRVFDLTAGPLWNVEVYKLEDEQHVLMFNLHHIIADGWSVPVFVEELAYFYNSYQSREKNELPALSFQYADYSKWQREQFDNGMFDAQLDYWRRQLKGSADVDYLPFDRKRDVLTSAIGKTLQIQLPDSFASVIRKQVSAYDTTVFTALVASFQLYLYFASGEQDVILGSSIANRSIENVDKLIGFFVNQVALRTVFDDNMNYGDVLKTVHTTTATAFQNQDIPFDLVVKELQVSRKEGRNPLFQTKLVLQNAPSGKLHLEGLEMRSIEVDNQSAKFDFLLLLEMTDNGVEGTVEYNTGLFEPYTIKRIIDNWTLLVDVIGANENLCLSEIRALFEQRCAEKQQIENDQQNELRNSKLKNIKRRQVRG